MIVRLSAAEAAFLYLLKTKTNVFTLLRFSFKFVLFGVCKEERLWLDIVKGPLDTPVAQKEPLGMNEEG